MTTPILPLHPCPHGCGARLGISNRTADGERGRCGQCRMPTVYQAGQLHIPAGVALILQRGTRAAMTPEQITAAAHRHANSSIRLDSAGTP